MTDTTQFDKQELEKRSEATLIALREYPNAEEILQRHADAMNEWTDSTSYKPPTLEKFAEQLTMDYFVNAKVEFYAELLSDPKAQVEHALSLLDMMTAEYETYSELLDTFRKKAAPFKNLLKEFERAVPYDEWKELTNGIWNQPKKYELVILYHLLQHVKKHKYTVKDVPPEELSDDERREIRERVYFTGEREEKVYNSETKTYEKKTVHVDREPQIAGVNKEFKKLIEKKRARKIVDVQPVQTMNTLTANRDKMMASSFEKSSVMNEDEVVQTTLDSPYFAENVKLPKKKIKVHVDRKIGSMENGEFVEHQLYNYHLKRIIDAVGSIEDTQPKELEINGCGITLDEVYRLICHNPNARLISSADEKQKKLIEEHNARVDSGELDKTERKYINTKEEELLKDLRYLISTTETIYTKGIAEGHDVELTDITDCQMIPATIRRQKVRHKNRVYEKLVLVPHYNKDGTIILPPRYQLTKEQKDEKGKAPFLTIPEGRLDTSYEYLHSRGIITAGYEYERAGKKYYHLVESVSDWDYYPDLKSLIYEKLNDYEHQHHEIISFDRLTAKLFYETKIHVDDDGRIHYKRDKIVFTAKESRIFVDAVKDIMSIFKAKNLIDDWEPYYTKNKVTGIHIKGKIHVDQPEPTVKTKEELKQIWDRFVADLKYHNVELKNPPKKPY